MKSVFVCRLISACMSHPTWGAWIEIAHSHRGLYLHQSHLTWCARNEILTLSLCNSKSDVTRFAGVRINVMWKPSLWIWRNTFVPCSLHRCLASLTIWVKQPLTAAAFQLKSVLHKPKDDFLCSQYACFGNSRLLYGSNSFLFCGRLFLSRSSIFRSERTSPARTAVFVLPLYKYIERRQMHVCRRRRFARRFVVSRSLFPKKKSPDCVGCLDLLSVGLPRIQKGPKTKR